MRQDLIKLIETHDEVTNAIILTHNIDFVFLQMIVLPALRRCGRPTLTVFADAHCAAESYAYQSPVLSTLGTRYRVVPVTMEAGFRFHPKALLLSGPTKATLWVGSGNLTFGGWRENAEVWVQFESDKDTTGPLASFRAYLHEILTRVPLAGSVKSEVDEAFDGQSREWAQAMAPPSGLLGRVGRGPSLLEQIKLIAGPAAVDELIICSPYYDPEGEALDRLLSEFKPTQKQVLVQQKYPGLPRNVAPKIQEPGGIIPVGFTRTAENGHTRESFIHAKFYAMSRSESTLVLAGSANCSRAALTLSGPKGNAELIAVQQLELDQFHSSYLAEIPRVEGELVLPEIPIDKTEAAREPIQILAARYDDGIVRIAFACVNDTTVTGCLADGDKVELMIDGHGLGWVELSKAPARVILEALWDGKVVHSREAWVDLEHELRVTARGRSLAHAIRESLRSEHWNIGAWQNVLDVFGRHLQYMPTRTAGLGRRGKKDRSRELAQFTAEDVFSADYGLPNFGSGLQIGIGEDRVRNLQEMLLRWFGVFERDELADEGSDQPNDSDDENSDDTVDRPEHLPTTKCILRIPKPITDADRKRAKKSLQFMTKAMSSTDFFSKRPPELLAADLKIAAVLLRTALQEGWINDTDFFNATWAVWSPLFFSSPGNNNQGWLERRYHEAEDQEDFIIRIASPELSAALAAWSMTATPDGSNPEHARYVLAQALAIARMPWIWRGGNPERIGQELARMLFNTGNAPSNDELRQTEQAWISMMRNGEAFCALEESLQGHSPNELRKAIAPEHILCGELLWQGTCGYCVALKDCNRSVPEPVPVLRLQDPKEDKPFQSHYLIPISSLLDPAVLPCTVRFGSAQRQKIAEMLSRLAKPFSASAKSNGKR